MSPYDEPSKKRIIDSLILHDRRSLDRPKETQRLARYFHLADIALRDAGKREGRKPRRQQRRSRRNV
jgi:hypothetical protein